MVALNEISDNYGARKSRIRVGRGLGSGKGKTCGRGEKGQKARTGVAIKGFEGGQMPLFRRLPKRGFHNINSETFEVVNLRDLARAIDTGKLDVKKTVDRDVLANAGLVRGKGAIKLLATGEVKVKLTLELDAASASAVKAIEAAGGTVKLTAPQA